MINLRNLIYTNILDLTSFYFQRMHNHLGLINFLAHGLLDGWVALTR